MSNAAPEGDKTNMNGNKKDKAKKKKAKKKNNNNKDVSDSASVSSVVSFDSDHDNFNILPYDTDLDYVGNFTLLQRKFQQHFDHKLLLIRTEFEAKVEALQEVIKNKDEIISNLSKELGEVKKSCDFLTEETSVLGGRIKGNELAIESGNKKYVDLVNKATDLEDRSRRNNLVFFNIAEEPFQRTHDGSSQQENCETKIVNILKDRGFFSGDYTLEIDRAHRLGPRKADNDPRPRPIIVRFSFFKDKERILENGRLFKGCTVTVSQDFSKATLAVHKELRAHAKGAQDSLNSDESQPKSIVRHRITYRRVVVTYSSNKNLPSAATFTRSYTLDFILRNRNWFIPPPTQSRGRTTYAQVSHIPEGYQDNINQ